MNTNILQIEIHQIKGISSLKIKLPLNPGVYAITGINGIGKSTLLSAIAPRLVRPINFSILRNFEYLDNSFISYTIGKITEKWQPTKESRNWVCSIDPTLKLRGFQEGSITKGTRFLNSSSYLSYKKLQQAKSEHLLLADDFVTENLGFILHNNKNHYTNLYRIDHNKAKNHYSYDGVPYFLKTNNRILSYFDLSTGEFLLINLLHLLNNLLVRTENREKLNMILIDEVELALHPSAIKRLVQFMKDISQKYSVSIYFSTHSLEIINALHIDNLFYLKQFSDKSIICENPCYPAYITRDIYSHSGYDIIILVEDDLAKSIVNSFINKLKLNKNKRIQILPVGGYENTLDLHQNLMIDKVLSENARIISIIDGDVKNIVTEKKKERTLWQSIPNDNILFLPIESLEKYLKVQLFDKENFDLMRQIRDYLFEFETDVDWFKTEYLQNIALKKSDDEKKHKPVKDDKEYFINGKNLFSILSEKFVSYNKTKSKDDFRKEISKLVIEYNDYTNFETKLEKTFQFLFP